VLCEQAYCHDGGSSFPQPTFQAIFFQLHPADVSELPDKTPDCLTFMSQFIMHNAPIKESSVAFTRDFTCCVFLGQGKASSVRIVIWFEHHNRKPTSHHQ
jgi:hypothetical protein